MSVLKTIIARATKRLLQWTANEEAVAKSLRDHAAGGDLTIGASAAVVTTRSGNTARLFKKRHVHVLRNYAEFSTIVRSAIDIYRNCIAQAKWQIVPHDPKRPINERVRDEITDLLQAPNPAGESYSVMIEKFVEDYLVIGHGALEKAIHRDLTPYLILPLDAARIALSQGWDGTDPEMPRYAELTESGMIKRWIPDPMAMVLVNRPRSYDSLGLSHVEALDIAVRALLEGDDTFLQQMIDRTPGGVFDLGEGVTQPQVDQFRQEIQALRKAFAVMGGSKNPKFHKFDASERDVRALDKLLYFKRQVAGIFQLPMAVLGELVDASRANTDAMLENSDKGPGALLWRICEMLNAQVVLKWGAYKEHNCVIDFPIMSRKDEKQQADVSKTQTAGLPWVTINQAARDAGKPTFDLPIADELLIAVGKTGYIPLSVLNAQYYDGQKLREVDSPGAKGKIKDESSQPAKALKAVLPFEHLRKSAHKFSTTQVDLRDELAEQLLEFAAGIPDEDLSEDGREDKPHVTIKYGLHTNNPDDVREVLKGEKPVTVRFGETSIFEADGYDVIIVEVKSRDLARLNKKLSEALEHTDTHDKYIPHATIAYVKSGKGALYAGDDFLSGSKVTIDRVVFSSKSKKRTVIELTGTEAKCLSKTEFAAPLEELHI